MKHYMRFILMSIFLSFAALAFAGSDQTDDNYSWIKNNKVKEKIKKIDKFREDHKSKAHFSGGIYFVFFYYFDVWQGKLNDHLGNVGYSTRDFRSDKYHNANNDGRIEKKPWGNIETGFYGNFSISTQLFESDKPLISDNKITFEFDWEFNWMQASAGIKFTFAPIPIYYTSLSFNIGTGWEWLWDSDGSPMLIGMGLSLKDGYASVPLMGPVARIDITNGLQMDFSALPGINEITKRWMHIILTASVNVGYQGLMNIDQNQPYIYLNNKNLLSGWNFSFTSEFGYMIPIIKDQTQMQSFRKFANRRFSILPLLQTVVGTNITHYNDSLMKEKGWGSDFVNVSLRPLLIFLLPYNFKLIMYTRFVNDKRYDTSTIGNIYYQDREYEDWYFRPDNIGFIFGWDF